MSGVPVAPSGDRAVVDLLLPLQAGRVGRGDGRASGRGLRRGCRAEAGPMVGGRQRGRPREGRHRAEARRLRPVVVLSAVAARTAVLLAVLAGQRVAGVRVVVGRRRMVVRLLVVVVRGLLVVRVRVVVRVVVGWRVVVPAVAGDVIPLRVLLGRREFGITVSGRVHQIRTHDH